MIEKLCPAFGNDTFVLLYLKLSQNLILESTIGLSLKFERN
jgi:hypothetical protein